MYICIGPIWGSCILAVGPGPPPPHAYMYVCACLNTCMYICMCRYVYTYVLVPCVDPVFWQSGLEPPITVWPLTRYGNLRLVVCVCAVNHDAQTGKDT